MNSFLQTLRNLGPTRLALTGGVVLLVVGVLIYIVTSVGGPGMQVIYRDLQPGDQRALQQLFDQSGISYELAQNQIAVPGDVATQARAIAAQAGLPGSGVSGYELFDNGSALGEPGTVLEMKKVRALEGEIAKSLRGMEGVQSARVHLVMPARRLFERDAQEASASVQLQLKRQGMRLAEGQVAAVQQLVAAAVPGLKPTAISITDNNGVLYASGRVASDNVVQLRAEEQKRSTEIRLTQQVEDALGVIVGRANVKATVQAEMDFNRETTNKELFDADGQVPRSSQTVTEEAESTETQGEDPVTVAQSLPDATAGITTGAGSYTRSTRTEETTNFEISKTNTTFIRETGEIRRLSVAVVVNGTWQPDGTYTPRTEKQMEVFQQVVERAVGARSDRGDEVVVVNEAFPFSALEDDKEPTILGIPESQFYKILETLLLGLVAVLVILLVARPLIARALEAATEGEEGLGTPGLPDRSGAPSLPGGDFARRLDESAEMEALEQMIDINQVEGRVRASSLRKIGEIVDKHPEEAVAILRNWMYQEA